MKLIASFFILVFAIGTQVVNGQLLTADELMDSINQWKEALEFRSTFVYREGFSASPEIGFSTSPITNLQRSAKGVFHKSGSTVHFSFYPDGDPEILGNASDKVTGTPGSDSPKHQLERAGAMLVKNAAEDELYNGDVMLAYTPAWNNFFDRATFSRQNLLSPDGLNRTEPCSNKRLSPMNPVPGCSVGFPGSMQGANAASEYHIKPIDDLHLEVTGESRQDTKQIRDEYRAEWSLKFGIPVLLRTQRKHIAPNSTSFVESRLTDFRECNGAHMAAHVIVAIWDQGEDKVFVREWKSEDLGRNQPANADFEIHIPSTTVVVGLKTPQQPGLARRLTLKGLAPEALAEDGVTKAADKKNVPTNDRSLFVIVGLNVLVLAVVITVLWFRRNSSRGKAAAT